MKIGIVATLKNEAPYILEWISYHLSIGIKDFYIANNNSTDQTKEILEGLHNRNIIRYIDFPMTDYVNHNPQLEIYNFIGSDFKKDVDWMAFIDGDEFIVLDGKYDNIYDALSKPLNNPDIGIIALNWSLFGSSFNFNNSDKITISRFIHKDSTPNSHYKSIVRSSAFDEFKVNPHICDIIDNFKSVNSDSEEFYSFDKVGFFRTKSLMSWKNARINHYVIRSLEEFVLKKQSRGLADTGGKRLDDFFNRHDANDTIEFMPDDIISKVINVRDDLIEKLNSDGIVLDDKIVSNVQYTFAKLNELNLTSIKKDKNIYKIELIDKIKPEKVSLVTDFHMLNELTFSYYSIGFFRKRNVIIIQVPLDLVSNGDNYYLSINGFNKNLGFINKLRFDDDMAIRDIVSSEKNSPILNFLKSKARSVQSRLHYIIKSK